MSNDDLIDDLNEFAGELFEVDRFEIRRPDYTSANTEYDVIDSCVSMYTKPAAATESQDKIPGAEYFLLTCRKSLIKPGDIIVPRCDTSLVELTVVNNDAFTDTIAVKTGMHGVIRKSAAKDMFTNVNFDYIRMGNPGVPAEPYMEGSLEKRSGLAFIRSRDGVNIGNYLVDTDSNIIWKIINVGDATHFTLLQLIEDRR